MLYHATEFAFPAVKIEFKTISFQISYYKRLAHKRIFVKAPRWFQNYRAVVSRVKRVGTDNTWSNTNIGDVSITDPRPSSVATGYTGQPHALWGFCMWLAGHRLHLLNTKR